MPFGLGGNDTIDSDKYAVVLITRAHNLLKYWRIGLIPYRLLSIFYDEDDGEGGGERWK